MTIRNWPKALRPREKLMSKGAHTLSDTELLAVLIGSGMPGTSAVELARNLLIEFRSLREMLKADQKALLNQPGLGPARFCTFQAALELARRHYSEMLSMGPRFCAPETTRAFLLAQLRDKPYEVFCCMHLDNRHRLIAFEELFRGTVDGANVHPREVLRQCLIHNTAAVILAHNHPSGLTEPSQADELVTSRLKQALGLMDVRLVDHLIVGEGSCLSFAEHGLL